MASLSARSHVPACAVTPCSRISFIVVWSAAWPRAQIETAAPAPANASAIERPIPRLPPMTTARLPFKLICINCSPQASGDIASPVLLARRPAQVLQRLVPDRGNRQRLEQHRMQRRQAKDELTAGLAGMICSATRNCCSKTVLWRAQARAQVDVLQAQDLRSALLGILDGGVWPSTAASTNLMPSRSRPRQLLASRWQAHHRREQNGLLPATSR